MNWQTLFGSAVVESLGWTLVTSVWQKAVHCVRLSRVPRHLCRLCRPEKSCAVPIREIYDRWDKSICFSIGRDID